MDDPANDGAASRTHDPLSDDALSVDVDVPVRCTSPRARAATVEGTLGRVRRVGGRKNGQGAFDGVTAATPAPSNAIIDTSKASAGTSRSNGMVATSPSVMQQGNDDSDPDQKDTCDERVREDYTREKQKTDADYATHLQSWAKGLRVYKAARDAFDEVVDKLCNDSQNNCGPEQKAHQKLLEKKQSTAVSDIPILKRRFQASAKRRALLSPQATDGTPLPEEAGFQNYLLLEKERRHWCCLNSSIQNAHTEMYSPDPSTRSHDIPMQSRAQPYDENDLDDKFEKNVLPHLQRLPGAVAARATAVCRQHTDGFKEVHPLGSSRPDFAAKWLVGFPFPGPKHSPNSPNFKVAFEMKCGKLEAGARHVLKGQVERYLENGYDMVLVVAFCTNRSVTPAMLGFSDPRVDVRIVYGHGQRDSNDEDDDVLSSPSDGDESSTHDDVEGTIAPYDTHTARGLECDDGEARRTTMPFYHKFKDSPEYLKIYFEKERYVDRVREVLSNLCGDVDKLKHYYTKKDETGAPELLLRLDYDGEDPGWSDVAHSFDRCYFLEHRPNLLCGGATQIGKTWFKTLGLLVARQFDRKRKVPSIIITTGVNGARELALKIARQVQSLNDSPTDPVDVMTNGQEVCLRMGKLVLGDKRTGPAGRTARRDMLRRGGTIVLAHSMSQIGDVFFDLLHLQEQDMNHGTAPIQPAVFVDEADEMQRSSIRPDGTSDRRAKVRFEYALLKFLGEEKHSHRAGELCSRCAESRSQGECCLVDNGRVNASSAKRYVREEERRHAKTRYPYFRPAFVVKISATLIPVFAELAARESGSDGGGLNSDDIFLCLAPKDAYVGIKDFKPLTQICGGRCVSCRASNDDSIRDGSNCALCEDYKERSLCAGCSDDVNAGGCGKEVDVYLEPRDLNPSNLHFNDKVKDLYREASTDPLALILHITTSRVNAPGLNIHSISWEAQKLYDDEELGDLAVRGP